MKHFHWLLIGFMILCLAIIPLAGCGVPQSEYEALQAEHATLVEENTRLKAEYESLQTEHTALTGETAPLQAELEQVQSELANMEEAHATLEKEYAAIKAQLTEIKRVYPLKHFVDYYELKDWVDEHFPKLTQVGPIKHFELQEMALADGYIWSVGYFPKVNIQSFCVAGSGIYWINYVGYIERVAVFK